MNSQARQIHETDSSKVIHGIGSPLISILKNAERIAGSEATVLLTGETGTGKEVFARHIHAHSRRAGGPFVPVNCGAIPENLLESELFGHVKGAFTGADRARKGRIELARGGTLFLDEVGEMPLSLQVKLLRVLQERVFDPVGSNESIAADFRLIAATNRDLLAEVEAGRFRRDLYYRLFVCPIELPSLCERPMDVVPLFRHFWAKLGEKRPVEQGVLARLESYAWPGNVRELENLCQRLSVCAPGEAVRVEDLPAPYSEVEPSSVVTLFAGEAECADGRTMEHEAEALRELTPPVDARCLHVFDDAVDEEENTDVDPLLVGVEEFPSDLPAFLRDLEYRFIDAALAKHGGNKNAAAKALGLRRTTLVEKLKRRAQHAARSEGTGDSAAAPSA
ncbi:MAG: AAA family ATPase [Deltaproteobacteria bacterium]|nr:MAG: AAA family ATPase [Deltaproteobacteria bacterium]